jgi:hypothetical protein
MPTLTARASRTSAHRAKRSRYHIEDKQRFVVSVVVYDSLPGHQNYAFVR